MNRKLYHSGFNQKKSNGHLAINVSKRRKKQKLKSDRIYCRTILHNYQLQHMRFITKRIYNIILYIARFVNSNLRFLSFKQRKLQQNFYLNNALKSNKKNRYCNVFPQVFCHTIVNILNLKKWRVRKKTISKARIETFRTLPKLLKNLKTDTSCRTKKRATSYRRQKISEAFFQVPPQSLLGCTKNVQMGFCMLQNDKYKVFIHSKQKFLLSKNRQTSCDICRFFAKNRNFGKKPSSGDRVYRHRTL